MITIWSSVSWSQKRIWCYCKTNVTRTIQIGEAGKICLLYMTFKNHYEREGFILPVPRGYFAEEINKITKSTIYNIPFFLDMDPVDTEYRLPVLIPTYSHRYILTIIGDGVYKWRRFTGSNQAYKWEDTAEESLVHPLNLMEKGRLLRVNLSWWKKNGSTLLHSTYYCDSNSDMFSRISTRRPIWWKTGKESYLQVMLKLWRRQQMKEGK